MDILKRASAGTMESSDAYVEIEPSEALTVNIESVVAKQFGDKIEVVEPKSLRDQVRRKAEEISKLYK